MHRSLGAAFSGAGACLWPGLGCEPHWPVLLAPGPQCSWRKGPGDTRQPAVACFGGKPRPWLSREDTAADPGCPVWGSSPGRVKNARYEVALCLAVSPGWEGWPHGACTCTASLLPQGLDPQSLLLCEIRIAVSCSHRPTAQAQLADGCRKHTSIPLPSAQTVSFAFGVNKISLGHRTPLPFGVSNSILGVLVRPVSRGRGTEHTGGLEGARGSRETLHHPQLWAAACALLLPPPTPQGCAQSPKRKVGKLALAAPAGRSGATWCPGHAGPEHWCPEWTPGALWLHSACWGPRAWSKPPTLSWNGRDRVGTGAYPWLSSIGRCVCECGLCGAGSRPMGLGDTPPTAPSPGELTLSGVEGQD